MKNILALYPAFSRQGFFNAHEIIGLTGGKYDSPPLGLLTVAALLPDNWDVRLVDLNIQDLDQADVLWADMVLISAMLYQQTATVRFIEYFQDKDVKVAVGGPDPTFQPHIYDKADYLFLGEAEAIIEQFVDDVENGIKRGVYRSEKTPDLTKSPIPRYDLANIEDYFRIGIQYTRGCPHNCEFCSITQFYGAIPRVKTTEQVLREMEAVYQTGFRGGIDFADDNFVAHKTKAKETLRAIIEWNKQHDYPFYFHTQVPIKIADDDQLLSLLRDAGFDSVLIGIETVDDSTLQGTNKPHNASRDLIGDLHKIYSYGISVIGTYIIGFDREPPDIAKKIIENIRDGHVWFPAVFQLYAASFTDLGRRLIEEDRLFAATNTTHFVTDDDLVDLVSSGINFVTDRPRTDIVRDYAEILESCFETKNYFDRCLALCLKLRRRRRFKPDRQTQKRFMRAIFAIIGRLGFRKDTAALFWRNFLAVLFRNPSSLFDILYQMGYFIHFESRASLSVSLLRKNAEEIESLGEDNYNRKMRACV